MATCTMPVPGMDKLGRLVLDERSRHHVYMTFYESPQKFWVQLVRHEGQIEELHNQITKFYDANYRPIKYSELGPGYLCIAKFSETDSYYRALVTKRTGENTAHVYFIDYGNSEESRIDALQELDRELFYEYPAQAIPCALPMNENVNPSVDISQFVNHTDLHVTVIWHDNSNGIHTVQLDTEGVKIPATIDVQPLAETRPKRERVPSGFAPVQFNLGNYADICISSVAEAGRFYCQLIDNAPRLDSLMCDIQDSYSDQNRVQELPVPRSACIVCSPKDGVLYRAQVVRCRSAQHCEVNYVDFGHSEVVSVRDIVDIQAEHLELPAQAISCTLSGADSVPPNNLMDVMKSYESQVPVVSKVLFKTGADYEVEVVDTRNGRDSSVVDLAKASGMSNSRTPDTSVVKADILPADVKPSGIENLYITCAVSPRTFFGQPTRYPSEALDGLQAALAEYYEANSRTVLPQPSVGDFCCAQFSEDEQWYRAKITSKIDRKWIVTFVDYGNGEDKGSDELFVLESQFCQLHQQGVHCILSQPLEGITTEELDGILVENEVKVSCENISPNGLQVSICDNQPILEKLRPYMRQAVKPQTAKSPVQGQQLQRMTKASAARSSSYIQFDAISVIPGESYDVLVTHVEDPENVSCQLLKTESELNSLMDQIDHYCSSLGPGMGLLETVGLGHTCIAQYSEDQGWYRAQVTGVIPSSESVEVLFVDYGNRDTVKLENLRKILPEFTTLAAQAVLCGMAGVCSPDVWPSEQTDALFKMVSEGKLTMLVVDANEPKAEVEMFSAEGNVNQKFGNLNNCIAAGYSFHSTPKARTKPVTAPSPARQAAVKAPSSMRSDQESMPKSHGDSTWATWQQPGVERPQKRPTSPASSTSSHSSRSGSVSSQKVANTSAANDLKYESLQLQVGTFLDINVVHVDTPGKFWVQLTEHCAELEKVMEKIETEYSRLEPGDLVSKKPKIGQPCATKFSEDESWYRAKVVNIDGKQVKVQFVDYGNGEWQKASEIRLLRRNYLTLPAQALCCSLDEISPLEDEWAEEAGEMLSTLTDDKNLVCKVLKQVNEVFFVQLVDTAAGRNLNIAKELLKKGLAKEKKVPRTTEAKSPGPVDLQEQTRFDQTRQQTRANAPKQSIGSQPQKTLVRAPVRIQTFSELDLPVGSRAPVIVTWVNGPKDFYCQMMEAQSQLAEMSQSMYQYYQCLKLNEQQLERPITGQACVAPYAEDGMWYRSTILGVKGSEARVLFVDYGNIEIVPLSKVKIIADQFLTLKVQAIQCSLSDVECPSGQWSSKTVSCFQKLMTEPVCYTVVSKQDKMYTINITRNDGSDVSSSLPECTKPLQRSFGANTQERQMPARNFGASIQEKQMSARNFGSASQGRSMSDVTQQSRPVENKVSFSSASVPVAEKPAFYPRSSVPQGKQSVYVSHIESPNCFYVQLADQSDAIDTLTETVQNTYASLGASDKKLTSVVKDQACCALYSEDGSWYRAKILEVGNTNVKVLFVDFGNLECTNLDSIRSLTPDLLRQSALAICCSLKDAEGVSNEKFEEIVLDKELVTSFHSATEPCVVSMEAEGTDILTLLGIQTSAQTPQLVQTDTAIGSLTVPNTTVAAYVSHVDTNIYLQLSAISETLEELTESLNSHYSSLDAEELAVEHIVVGHCYCAKFSEDEAWYRARVTNVQGKDISVHFVDFGNSDVVQLDSMKMLKKEYAKFAPFAICCTLKSGDLGEEDTAKVLELAEEKELNVTFKSNREPYLIDAIVDGVNMRTLLGWADQPIGAEEPPAVNQISEPQLLLPPLPRPGHESIYVSHVESLNEFYVQLSNSSEDLESLSTDLQEFYGQVDSKAPNLDSVCEGEVCCAKYSEDSLWYRAKVVSVKDGSISLHFVDYGNYETTTLDGLKAPDPKFLSQPAFAIMCTLGVESMADTLKADNFLELTDGKELAAQFFGSFEPFTVKLSDGEVDVLEQLTGGTVESKEQVRPLMVEEVASHGPPVVDEVATHRSITKFKEVDLRPEEYMVSISHLNTINDFYVQIVDQIETLETMSSDMNEEYKDGAGEAVDCVEPGQACCVKFSEDGAWYRAKVRSCNGDDIDVLFVDFGNSEITTIDQIRSFDGLKYLDQPPFAIQCSLQSNDASSVLGESLEEMSNNKELSALFSGSKQPYSVNLSDGGVSINEKLGLNVVIETEECDQVLLPETEIPTHAAVYVSHTDNLARFYLQLASKSDALSEFSDALNNRYTALEGESHRLSKVNQGMVCCALFSEDDSWYRAKVMDVRDSMVDVLFVDYGNAELAPTDNLRYLEEAFSHQPAFAFECQLKGADSVSSDDLVNPFVSATADKELQAVIDKSTVPHLVSLQDEDINIATFLGIESGVVESPACVDSAKVIGEKKVDNGIPGEEEEGRIPEEDTRCRVYVSHTENFHSFYLQLSSTSMELDTLVEQLNDAYSSIDCDVESVTIGELYAAKFADDDSWYRAKATSICDDKIIVHFIDYGNDAKCSIASLRQLQPEFKEKKAHAIHCRFSSTGETEEQLDKFIDLTSDKELSVKFSGEEEPYAVSLYDDENLSLEEQLGLSADATADVAKPSESSTSTTSTMSMSITLSPFPSANPPSGTEPIFVSHVEDPQQFFVQLVSRSDELDEMTQQLQNYASEVKRCAREDLAVGSPCAALYMEDSTWYRAVVEKIGGDTVQVNFVDYGNKTFVPTDNVCALPSNALSTPPYAFQCELDSFPSYTEGQSNHFKELVEGKELTAIFKDDDAISCAVELLDPEGSSISSMLGPVPEEKSPDSNYPKCVVPKEEVKVKVSYIKGDGYLYVQLCSQEAEQEEFCRTLNSVYREFATEELTLSSSDTGVPCCVLFSEDDTWYRAIITGSSEDGIEVIFIDYGNSEVACAENLKILQPQFLRNAPFAVYCRTIPDSSLVEGHERIAKFSGKKEPYVVQMRVDEQDVLAQLRGQAAVQDGLDISVDSQAGDHKDLSVSHPPHIGDSFGVQIEKVESPSQFWCKVLDSSYRNLELECILDGVQAKSSVWSSDAIEYFKEKVIGKKLVAEVTMAEAGQGDGPMCCAIKLLDGEISLSQQLLELNFAIDSTHAHYPSAKSDYVFHKVDTLTMQSLNIPCRVEVRVTNIQSPSQFWIQIKSNQSHIDKLTVDMVEFYDEVEDDSQQYDYEVGVVYAAASKEDNCWYRVELKEIMEEKLSVHFIDFGMCETIDKTAIKPLNRSFTDLPVQCMQCSLHDVIACDNAWTDDAVALFTNYVTGCSSLLAEVMGEIGDAYSIKLLDMGMSVGGKLVNEGVAVQIDADDSELDSTPTLDVATLRFKSPVLEVGETVTVYIPVEAVESPNMFQAQLSEAASNQLPLLMDRIHEQYNEERHASLSELTSGSPCVAKSPRDKNWYRAEVVSLHDSDIQVRFVDYGNCEWIEQEDIRDIAPEFVELPRLAFPCSLCSVCPCGDQWDEASCARFKEFMDKELVLSVKNVENQGEENYLIEGLLQDGEIDISVQLVEGGYAQTTSRNSLNDSQSPLPDVKESSEGELSSSYLDESALNETAESLVLQVMANAAAEIDKELESSQDIEKEIGSASTEVRARRSSLRRLSQDLLRYCHPDIDVGSEVKMLYLLGDSPSSFICRLASSDSDLKSLMGDIGSPPMDTVMEQEKLCVGQPCLAKYTEDGSWYRAVINTMQGNICEVKFVDYGNRACVSIDCLQPLPKEGCNLPVQAVHCSLAGIQCNEITEEQALNKLEDLCKEKTLTARIVSKTEEDLYSVYLYESTEDCSTMSINQQLVDCSLAVIVTDTKQDPILQVDVAETSDFHANEAVDALVEDILTGCVASPEVKCSPDEGFESQSDPATSPMTESQSVD